MEKDDKFAIGLGITSTCNMGCSFCYSINRRKDSSDIPLEKWMEFFRNNEGQIRDINFGTGENTLINDWFSLIEFINDLNPKIDQALTTNGSLVSRIEKDMQKDRIVTKCLSDVDVSLDYSNENKHNLFRGHKKAFGMALDTLAYCKVKGFNTSIVVMGIDDNLTIQNMEGIFEIAKTYDALVRVNIYRPVNKDNGLVPPSFDTLLKLFDWVYENHEICSLSDPLFSSVLSFQDAQKDPSGSNSLRILPNGTIYPSTYLISQKYCIGDISDKEVLEKARKNDIVRLLTTTVPEYCNGCDVVEPCGGGTIDRRILWHGTVEKQDPYCPKNSGYSTSLRSYKVNRAGFSSIHDGYLPTIFFKPK